jgi:hypothetical protein
VAAHSPVFHQAGLWHFSFDLQLRVPELQSPAWISLRVLHSSGRSTFWRTGSRSRGFSILPGRWWDGRCWLRRSFCAGRGLCSRHSLCLTRWRGFRTSLSSTIAPRRSDIRCGLGSRIRKWWRWCWRERWVRKCSVALRWGALDPRRECVRNLFCVSYAPLMLPRPGVSVPVEWQRPACRAL